LARKMCSNSLYSVFSDSDSELHTAMATSSIPRKTSKIWCYFAEQSDSAAKCNFCSKSISFKGGNLFNLTRHVPWAHPAISLSIERLTPTHNPPVSIKVSIYWLS
jgi:hypothetical protein